MIVSSPRAMAVLSFPPVRGSISVLFLVLVTGLPSQPGGHGALERIALGGLALLLGSAVWAMTLRGFVSDLREPRRLANGAVVLAHRRRRLARILSWTALVVVILDGLWLGLLVSLDGPDWAAPACLLSFGVALAVASCLPRASRWYADGAGLVGVAPEGLVLDTGGADLEIHPWSGLGTLGPAPSAAQSLSIPTAEKLGRRVRWRPGARDAAARWAREGFAPTAAEVRRLKLDQCWASGPEARRASCGQPQVSQTPVEGSA